MEYRKRLDEIVCWLTKAENTVLKRSTTELEENLKELTVSGWSLYLPTLFVARTFSLKIR